MLRTGYKKRRFSAWLLLAVFVPMMVVSALHVHGDASAWDAECEQCAQHIRHDGHVSEQSASVDDCVLCQFLSLQFLFSAVAAFVLFAAAVSIPRSFCVARVQLGVWDAVSARAPPFFCLTQIGQKSNDRFGFTAVRS